MIPAHSRPRLQIVGTGLAWSTAGHAITNAVTRVVHVPFAVEQDEDGVRCGSALLRPGVGVVGDGPTQEAAIADLREALERSPASPFTSGPTPARSPPPAIS